MVKSVAGATVTRIGKLNTLTKMACCSNLMSKLNKLEMLNFFIFAFLTACVSHLWDICLREGMIFGRLGDWLHYSKAWYAKPLGGCVVCANVWHSMIAYVVLICATDRLPEPGTLEAGLLFIAFIALSNFMVRVMNRVL